MRHLVFLLLISWLGVSPAHAQKLRVGQTFPEMELVDIHTQQKLTRHDLQGKVVIVDFWASWCEPCKDAFPFFNGLYKERKEKGLLVVGINVDDQLEPALKFAKENPVQFQLVYDEGRKLTKQVGVGTIPTTYVLDRNGKVTDLHRGFTGKQKNEMIRELDRLLGK